MTQLQDESFFRTIIENSSDIIAVVGDDGKIGFVSPSIKRILGVDPKDIVGKKFNDYIHPSDLEIIRKIVTRGLSSPDEFNFGEFRVRLRDGSFRTFEGIGKSIIDSSGKIRLIANAHDITDRKKTEERMRQRDEVYRIIAETAHDMIFIIDKDDKIEYVNAFGANQFGKKPEDIIGKSRAVLFPSFVSKRQEDSLKKVFISGCPHYFANEIPFPKGRMILDTWLIPIRDESGNVKSVYGISRDVTAIKITQEELEKRTSEADEARKKAQMYFDFLAHDIANLASPILSYSETIKDIQSAPKEITEFASKIAEQSKQMASLIHNLRMLAEAEKVSPEESDILDMRTMLTEMKKAFEKGNPNFKITFDVPSEGPIEVIGGPHVRNAFLLGIAYANRNVHGETMSIEIKMLPVKKSDGQSFWQLRMQIPDRSLHSEIREMMETPFDPSKRFKRKAGTDLLFAISIFEHFGGKLWAEDFSPNDPKKGYSVVIELPRATGWSSGHST